MEAQSKKGNSQSLIAHKGKEGEDEVKKKKRRRKQNSILLFSANRKITINFPNNFYNYR